LNNANYFSGAKHEDFRQTGTGKNAAISFAEAILVRRPINHEVWQTILFSAAFVLVSAAALAIAFLVSIDDPAMKTAQIPLTAALPVFVAIAFPVIGYPVNTKLPGNIFRFARYDLISLDGFGAGFFDKFSVILFNVYAAFWGYTSAPVLHKDGFLSIVSLVFFASSIACFAFLLKNIH
jgi:hypothetical protein